MDLQQRLAALPSLRGQFGVHVPAPRPVSLIFQSIIGSVNDINIKTRYPAPAPAPVPAPAPQPASAPASVSVIFCKILN
jgi:hypothetical protein